MDYVGILANVILYTTVGTLIAAIAAYTAYKLRDKRKPSRKVLTHVATGTQEFIFLKRYVPDGASTPAAAAGGRAVGIPSGPVTAPAPPLPPLPARPANQKAAPEPSPSHNQTALIPSGPSNSEGPSTTPGAPPNSQALPSIPSGPSNMKVASSPSGPSVVQLPPVGKR